MKAAVLYQPGRPLVVEEGIEIPGLEPEQVLVKLAYSGVCRSQLMEVRGHRGRDDFLPHLLGHEGSGLVLQAGARVRKVRPGDHVVLGWIKGKGRQTRQGACYRKGLLRINAGWVTTFNEYALVSENRCVKLPPGIGLDVAVLFGCAIPTGAGIVLNQIRPKAHSSIAVFGLGGVGFSALMAAGLLKCRTLIAADVVQEKLRLAEEFGATHLVDCSREDPVEAVRRITRDAGVDYAVESSGSSRTIEQAFACVKKQGGMCVFASHPGAGDFIKLDPFDLICGKRIAGSWGGACRPDRDIPRLTQLFAGRRLPVKKLLSRPYALEEINQALDDLENHRVIRALIKIDGNL